MITAILIVVGLMLVGVALLAIEVVILPGVGLVGLLGLAGVGAAIWVAYAMIGPAYAGVSLAGAVVASAAAFWLLPRTKVGRSMVLETATTARVGDPRLAELVGKEGVALTPLRPAGTVEVDGRPVDVVTDGEYVERGSRVRVVVVRGSRVQVESVPDQPAA